MHLARLVLVAAGLIASWPAHAGPAVHIHELDIHGDLLPGRARSYLERALSAAGYDVVFAPAGSAPCGADAACLSTQGKRAGALLSGTVTVLGLAGNVSVVLTLVEVASGRSASHTRPGVNLDHNDQALARWIVITFGPPPVSSRADGEPLAWAMTGVAVALALTGGLSLLHAESVESDFRAQHINDRGQVHSISRSDAEAWESRARRWAAAGWISLGLASGSGIAATILFMDRGRVESGAPLGVGLSGSF
jgi:hypothetical protein